VLGSTMNAAILALPESSLFLLFHRHFKRSETENFSSSSSVAFASQQISFMPQVGNEL
jgi:hypothetical protein